MKIQSFVNIIGCFSFLLFLSSCSFAQIQDSQSSLNVDKNFFNYNLDLSRDGVQVGFTGSTSCGMKIEVGGDVFGGFYPQCSATNPNTEVAYHRLAMLFGKGDLVQKGMHYDLDSKAINKFISVIPSNVKGKQQRKNCDNVKKAVDRNESVSAVWNNTAGKKGWLPGVLKRWDTKKPVDYDNFRRSGGVNGLINKNDKLVKLLQANNPQPNNRSISLSGRIGNELELAKGASFSLVLDTIFGQWDRYSGGNFQLIKESNGLYRVGIVDNGGAHFGYNWAKMHVSAFSRYEQMIVDEVGMLSQFIEQESAGYKGYKSHKQFATEALGLRDIYGQSVKTMWSRFSKNVLLLNKKCRQTSKYMARKPFFSN